MVTEYINGLMGVFTKVIGYKIKYLVMENILGMIKEHIKDTGWIIICTDKEFINGRMVENMRVII
jgi:hypothetical protein